MQFLVRKPRFRHPCNESAGSGKVDAPASESFTVSGKTRLHDGQGRLLLAPFTDPVIQVTANASVAQLVEQLTLNQFVVGSNPTGGTTSPSEDWRDKCHFVFQHRQITG